MNPVLLPAILNAAAPVLAAVVFLLAPVAIVWIVKNHQYRMKELELEAQRTPPRVEERLAAIEARLAAIEAALAPPAQSALQGRASLLEGPPLAQPVQLRDR